MFVPLQSVSGLSPEAPDHLLRHMGPPFGQMECILNHFKIFIDNNDPSVKDICDGVQLHIHRGISAVHIHVSHSAHLIADDQTLVLNLHNPGIDLSLAEGLIRHHTQNPHGKRSYDPKQKKQRHLQAEGFLPLPFFQPPNQSHVLPIPWLLHRLWPGPRVRYGS